MTRLPKVLVTGVQEHQGLAVVRGLGTAGFPVVACASHRHSLGFYSRFAGERERYTPPFESPQRFLDDLVRIIRRTRPALVIPTIESTMVVLSAHREEVERYGAVLAAPSREALAARLGIPAPRTAQGDNIEAILAKAADLRFPVAIKPRGNALHGATANALGFKVRYAMDLAELAATLAPFTRDARALLVQEYAAGIGRCVSALCRRGQPLAMFAYEREREYPLSGGVSVLRRTIPLDSRLADWSSALLGSLDWHGVAMVEFKYDRRGDDRPEPSGAGRPDAPRPRDRRHSLGPPRRAGTVAARGPAVAAGRLSAAPRGGPQRPPPRAPAMEAGSALALPHRLPARHPL